MMAETKVVAMVERKVEKTVVMRVVRKVGYLVQMLVD